MQQRPTRPSDLESLHDIEAAAGALFRTVPGMEQVADDPPPSLPVLRAYVEAGCSFVTVDEADRPVAYLLVEPLDGFGHIEQVTVHPAHARRRLGEALIDHADSWAQARGLNGLSLTTFRDVPWNAPYYSRLGFDVLPPSDWTPGLRAKMSDEALNGLAHWNRVVMVRARPA